MLQSLIKDNIKIVFVYHWPKVLRTHDIVDFKK